MTTPRPHRYFFLRPGPRRQFLPFRGFQPDFLAALWRQPRPAALCEPCPISAPSFSLLAAMLLLLPLSAVQPRTLGIWSAPGPPTLIHSRLATATGVVRLASLVELQKNSFLGHVIGYLARRIKYHKNLFWQGYLSPFAEAKTARPLGRAVFYHLRSTIYVLRSTFYVLQTNSPPSPATSSPPFQSGPRLILE